MYRKECRVYHFFLSSFSVYVCRRGVTSVSSSKASLYLSRSSSASLFFSFLVVQVKHPRDDEKRSYGIDPVTPISTTITIRELCLSAKESEDHKQVLNGRAVHISTRKSLQSGERSVYVIVGVSREYTHT